MEKIWKRLLLCGSGIILVLSAAYYFIMLFNYPVIEQPSLARLMLPFSSLKYWVCAGVIFVAFIAFCLVQIAKNKKGKHTHANEIIEAFTKYRFLLGQLVGKEFKLKYRRSYLGIAWSLINPLLMMIVISAVFSYVFRFDIENFPAYLILGQTMFSFFSEATQVSLVSIVTSGQLIKKVYMPKYIFPLSRVVSSFINLLITFIPVFAVLLYYGIFPDITIAFLPLFFVYFFIFTLGIGLILATAEVFMRDVQHLYSVFLTALGYATPVFYPVEALSETMQKIMNLNPLYHYVRYLRDILFYHNVPTIEQNLVCLVLALLFFVAGIIFFVKKQKKFILFI